MALIVEDGSGRADAESYLSVAEADAYFAERGGPAAWTGAATADKEAALRYAARWLDGRYRWRGAIFDAEQGLGWPRTGARDDDGRTLAGVPQRLKDAAAELALAHLDEALNAARDRETRRERVNGLEVEYAAGAAPARRHPYVDGLLRGLVVGGTAGVPLERA